ncbi:MAG TPA: hypothetical protein VE976_02295 [Actinomycetota bacterium]|nr:hypothetical protein [Actinomycetota bacterium]
MRRLLLAVAAAIVALVLLYPVSCAGGEFESVNTCETVTGLTLPGFAYRANEEYKVYVVPIGGAIAAAWASWWLAGRRRLTSRS